MIVLGMIHVSNREDLAVLYRDLSGCIYQVSFLTALGLIWLTDTNREAKRPHTRVVLACIGLILLMPGAIIFKTLNLEVVSYPLGMIGFIMIIISDFMTEKVTISRGPE